MRIWQLIGLLLWPLKWIAFFVLSRTRKSTRPRVAILRQGEILLVQNWGDRIWALPGGGVHRGEEVRRCAQREIAEELGIVAPGGALAYIDTIEMPMYSAPLLC